MELDTINRLYLELAQVATAVTSREAELKQSSQQWETQCKELADQFKRLCDFGEQSHMISAERLVDLTISHITALRARCLELNEAAAKSSSAEDTRRTVFDPIQQMVDDTAPPSPAEVQRVVTWMQDVSKHLYAVPEDSQGPADSR